MRRPWPCSHQLPKRQRGFEILHDSMLLTIFSASNYGGACQNKGGVLIFDEQGPAEHLRFAVAWDDESNSYRTRNIVFRDALTS